MKKVEIKDQKSPSTNGGKKSFLNPHEVIALVLTTFICGFILLPKFTANKTSEFKASSLEDYILLGYGVSAITATGSKDSPFHTDVYFMYYEDNGTDAEYARVNDIFQYTVPKIHALSDRYNYYYTETIYPDEEGFFVDSILNHPIPNPAVVYQKTNPFPQSETRLNNLRVLNENLNKGPLEIPFDLYNLLTIGKEMTIYTNSGYNMFVGSLSSFWDQQNDLTNNDYPQLNDPRANTDEGRANRTLVDRLQSYIPLTEEEVNATLSLSTVDGKYYANFVAPGVEVGDLTITVGGIAKGYCNEIIETQMQSNELGKGVIYGGASSINALSGYIDPSLPWKLAIQSNAVANSANGFDAKAFGFSYLGAFGMSTSGGDSLWSNYYFEDDEGNIFHRHHIIDARTGEPSNYGIVDVNVLSNFLTGSRLDALTTALMCLPISEGENLLENIRQDYTAEDNDILYGAWLLQAGNTNVFNIKAEAEYIPLLSELNDVKISKI